MQVTAEQTTPCTVTLDIAVDEEQVSRAFDRAYKEAGRYVNIRGFRPGKAPRALVENNVNKEKIRERALEFVITDSYLKAIEEEDLTPYRQPEIEPTDIEDKKPFTFKAIIPLEPQITLGEYTGLTVDKPIFKITDELVEQRLDALRQDKARLERITDRGVQVGDVLIAEQQIVLEGDDSEPIPPRRQLVQLGSNLPGYDEEILGMMPGDERTFSLTYPEDHEEEARRGKNATFTLKLSSISGKKLPDLTDEFAKSIGEFETIDALRTAIRERLDAEAIQLSDQVAEQNLFGKILENSTIDFPEVLIREEVQDTLRRLANDLRQNNMPYSQFLLNNGGITAEQHQAGLAQQAELQIRTLLALREISIQEDLQATDEQVDAEFDRLISGGIIDDQQALEFRADGRRRLQIANALIQQRLHDFLFANNTLTEVEAQKPPEDEELAEAGEEPTIDAE